MTNVEVDIKSLITLVKVRPVLWDKTLSTYKDRCGTMKAWKEVCTSLNREFERMSDNEKHRFVNEVVKKWSNVRDSYVKNMKKLYHLKRLGETNIPFKRYIYSNQLQFLSKLIKERPVGIDVDSTNAQQTDEETEIHPATSTSTQETGVSHREQRSITKSRYNESELRLLRTLENNDRNYNRHLSFFKGIIPCLEQFTEDEIITFQIEVLLLIEKIKRNKQHANAAVQQPYFNHQNSVTYLIPPIQVQQSHPGSSQVLQPQLNASHPHAQNNYVVLHASPTSPSHYTSSPSPTHSVSSVVEHKVDTTDFNLL